MNITSPAPLTGSPTGGFVYNIHAANGTYPYSRVKSARINVINNEQDSWYSLNTRFLALKTSAGALVNKENWVFYRADDPTTAFSATPDTAAGSGSHTVRIDRLARFHRIASDRQESLYDPLGITGTLIIGSLEVPVNAADSVKDLEKYLSALNNATVVSEEQAPGYTSGAGIIGVNTREFAVTAGTTLEGIRDQINANPLTGAWAAVSGNRLYLGAPDGSAVTVSEKNGSVLTGLGMMAPGSRLTEPYAEDVAAVTADSRLYLERRMSTERLELGGDPALWQSLGFLDGLEQIKNEITAAGDARIVVDGEAYERTSNSIDDIITGITLDLEKVMDVARYVSVTRDISGPRGLIEDFTARYNTAVEEVNGLLTDNGLLRLDRTLWEIRDEMVDTFDSTIDRLDASMNTASEAGLNPYRTPAKVIDDFTVGGDRNRESGPYFRAKGVEDTFNQLSRIGIIYNESLGTLEIDRTRLDAALETEPDATRELFIRGADSLARRVRSHMEELTGTPVGTVADRLSVLEIEKAGLEAGDPAGPEGDIAYASARNTYLNLLAVRNMMAEQAESYLNTVGYVF